MAIISGVPAEYVAPPDTNPPAIARPVVPGSGIAIGATPKRELLTADMGERDLLAIQAQLLFSILVELRLNNQNMFPNVNWDNERQTTGDPLAADISNLSR